jgi:hypothetical protein
MRAFQICEEASHPPERQSAGAMSANALGVREVRTKEEADLPLDYAELRCVGTMDEVWKEC